MKLFDDTPNDGASGSLGELLQEGESNGAWSDFIPDAWWWCCICFAVCQEKEIYVYGVDGDDYEGMSCPHCGNAGDAFDTCPGLYWYHGWPSRVVLGWVPAPVSGHRFPLPQEPSRRISLPSPESSETVTKNGSEANSHHNPFKETGLGGSKGGGSIPLG